MDWRAFFFCYCRYFYVNQEIRCLNCGDTWSMRLGYDTRENALYCVECFEREPYNRRKPGFCVMCGRAVTMEVVTCHL